jgi:hypothetical protein
MQPRCRQRLVEFGAIRTLATFDFGKVRDDLPVATV